MVKVQFISPTRVIDIIEETLEDAKGTFMMRFGFWPNAYNILKIERID